MTIVTVGIDLAKNLFAVHSVDGFGKPVLVRQESTRAKLLELIATLPPCLTGMEACFGAHHWAREFAKFDHTVRMIAPKFVVLYRMSGKLWLEAFPCRIGTDLLVFKRGTLILLRLKRLPLGHAVKDRGLI